MGIKSLRSPEAKYAAQLSLESLRRYRLPSSVIPLGVDEATETTDASPESLITYWGPYAISGKRGVVSAPGASA